MTDETTIPKPRFDAVLARAKEAESALAKLQADHQQLTADAKAWQRNTEIADELRIERDTLQAQLSEQQQTGAAHLAMVEAGITDGDVRDYALHRYQQQVGTEGAMEWGDWWNSQREAPGAVLRPFLSASEAPAAPAPQGVAPSPSDSIIAASAPPAPAAPAAPQANAGTVPTPAAAQAYTPGSIASLPREARKAALEAALTNGAAAWPFN